MIYFLQANPPEGAVKIGWARNVEKRIRELRAGQPHKASLIRTVDAPQWVERWLHERFQESRLESEWFSFCPDMMTIEPPAERVATLSRRVARTGLYVGGMHHITSSSKQVSVRLPLDLVAWVDAQSGTRTDIVEAALQAMRAASKPTAVPPAPVGSLMKGKS